MKIDWGYLLDEASKTAIGLDLVVAALMPFENLIDEAWLEQDPNDEWLVGVKIVLPDPCLCLVEGRTTDRYWVARIWPSWATECEAWLTQGVGVSQMTRSEPITPQDLWGFLRQFPARDLESYCKRQLGRKRAARCGTTPV
jgi:hypothetical protein